MTKTTQSPVLSTSITWTPDRGYQKMLKNQRSCSASDSPKQTEKPKLWLGAEPETQTWTAARRTCRTGANPRPAACSPGPGYTWTRAVGERCTLWRAVRPRRLVCRPSCSSPAATSAPWAGSPGWTSCSPSRSCSCPPSFRFCSSRPWAVIITTRKGHSRQI